MAPDGAADSAGSANTPDGASDTANGDEAVGKADSTAMPSARTAFDNAYMGRPTWEIGRPQGAVMRLERAGTVRSAVIDVGCGTGENARFLAGLGYDVLGVDFAPGAIARARAAAARDPAGTTPAFLVWDALELHALGRAFETALDIGCFHTLQPADRPRYADSLHAVLRPGGRCFLLCWSDRNPFGRGPERVSRADIRAAFRSGWSVDAIDAEELETLLPEGRVHAWLARLRRA